MVILIISGITLLLCLIYIIVVAVLVRGWKVLPFWQPSGMEPLTTTVSVVIAARNEERNIAKTIDAILAQDYPKDLFELIIVDDHSTDKTPLIIDSYAACGVKLLLLRESEKLNSYKKKAISKAIETATGELIVATDADCYMGPRWLSTIVSLYQEKHYRFISSPVTYAEERSYFERLQTLEFLYLIGIGASSIGLKQPSTCNGANLAYRRDVFYELDGFKGIDDLASGDDELFLHKVAKRYPEAIGFCKSRDAMVYTAAKENMTELIRQRRRWASKSTKYKNKKIVALGVGVWLFNLMILLTATLGIAYAWAIKVTVIVLLAKMFIELVFACFLTRFARRPHLLWNIPLLSILHMVYLVYIGIAGNTGKYQWKGRMVK